MTYESRKYELDPQSSYRQSDNSASRLSAMDFVKLDDRSPTKSTVRDTTILNKLSSLENQIAVFQSTFDLRRRSKAESYQQLKKYLSENLSMMVDNRNQIEQINIKTCEISDSLQNTRDCQAVYEQDLMHYGLKVSQIEKGIQDLRRRVVATTDKEKPARSRSSRKTYQ